MDNAIEMSRSGVSERPANVLLDLKISQRAVARLDEIADFTAKAFVKGVDFGPPYPGSNKAVILKPGAEKLLAAFGLRVEFRNLEGTIEDWDTPLFNYNVEARVYYGDNLVASAVASANSRERSIGKADVYSKVNDIWKKACKRAMGGAVLILTGLDSKFTEEGGDYKDQRQKAPRVAKTCASAFEEWCLNYDAAGVPKEGLVNVVKEIRQHFKVDAVSSLPNYALSDFNDWLESSGVDVLVRGGFYSRPADVRSLPETATIDLSNIHAGDPEPVAPREREPGDDDE